MDALAAFPGFQSLSGNLRVPAPLARRRTSPIYCTFQSLSGNLRVPAYCDTVSMDDRPSFNPFQGI